MSSGPVEEYTGISGVADPGGDSLTEDLNIYYSVRTAFPVYLNESESKAMTLIPRVAAGWGLCVDHDMLRPRAAHGSGRRLLLQRPRAPQVRPGADMAGLGVNRRGRLPVVLLGLLAHLLPHGERLHRGPQQLRPHEGAGPAQRRQQQAARHPILPVPGHVRRHHVRPRPSQSAPRCSRHLPSGDTTGTN